jgi:hypothetical protein
MKKSILFTLLALLVVAGTSQATIIPVDFAGLGSTFADITAPNAPFTVGPVTFSYENFGAGSVAFVSSAGVAGITDTVGIPPDVLPPVPGVLTLQFGGFGPSGLHFTFEILAVGGTLNNGDPVPDAVDVSLSGGPGIFQSATFDSTSGNAFGAFSFSGGTGPQAALIFTTAGAGFQITSMDVTVPEPGTMALTGSFLIMLGLGSRRLLKRRS